MLVLTKCTVCHIPTKWFKGEAPVEILKIFKKIWLPLYKGVVVYYREGGLGN